MREREGGGEKGRQREIEYPPRPQGRPGPPPPECACSPSPRPPAAARARRRRGRGKSSCRSPPGRWGTTWVLPGARSSPSPAATAPARKRIPSLRGFRTRCAIGAGDGYEQSTYRNRFNSQKNFDRMGLEGYRAHYAAKGGPRTQAQRGGVSVEERVHIHVPRTGEDCTYPCDGVDDLIRGFLDLGHPHFHLEQGLHDATQRDGRRDRQTQQGLSSGRARISGL